MGSSNPNFNVYQDNLSSKLTQVESSLVVTKTVNNELLKRVTSLERGLHSQEQYIVRRGVKASHFKNNPPILSNSPISENPPHFQGIIFK